MTDELKKKALIEQLCRTICRRHYMLDPDQMVFMHMPQVIQNMGHLSIGFMVPSPVYQQEAWTLFKKDVELILEEYGKLI